MTAHDDRDLKSAFEALGSEVTGPSFHELTSREAFKTARWRQRRRRATQASAVLAIAAFLAIRGGPDRELDYGQFTALTGIDLSQVTWEAPSDFLLDVPGRDLLRRVPRIEIQLPAPAADSTRPPDSNDTKRRSPS